MIQWNRSSHSEIEDSIFAIMSKLAFQHQAVNLGQGYPDFDGPSWVKEAACKAIMEKPNQYANMAGIYSLRCALAEKYSVLYGVDYNPDSEIIITNGASEALYLTLSALCKPGDEVIIFEPAYDVYAPIIRRAGATPVGVQLQPPLFSFSVNNLASSLSKRTRAILINTPHNPTGRVFNSGELTAIQKMCVQHNLIAITDEVYEHLIFEGNHISLASLDGMRERTVTISSTAKTFSMTGWKIGYILAPAEATDLMRKLHQLVCFCVAKPLQHGMAEAVQNWQRAVTPLMKKLRHNRDLLVQGLEDIGFEVFAPQGTFFLIANYAHQSNMKDNDFAVHLIKQTQGVATIPVSGFYLNPQKAPQTLLRFCFAKEEETLVEGLARLKKIMK
ncbi:MAG: aminotransferase [Acidobacteria bacterium]|nr:MAG: aminotransferase [Acidobacteriota bacterium]